MSGERVIANVRGGTREYGFETDVRGTAHRVSFRTETPLTPSADAALAACLMPAMREGGVLRIEDPVSPRLLRGAREFAAIQRAWSAGWKLGAGALHEVELRAGGHRAPQRAPSGRVAAFFSGGVDSFALLAREPRVTDLIFVRGVDILPDVAHQDGLADLAEARLRRAAAELGRRLHVVDTDVRRLSDPLIPWEVYFACPLIAIALLFEASFDRVLIAGDTDYETQGLLDYGAIWNVEQLWSTEAVEIVSWGGRLNREQRLRLVVEDPVAQRELRVCWRNLGGAYNCGRCQKCLRAMLSFEALGVRERMESFPPQLDLEQVKRLEISQMIEVILWEDALTTARGAGRPDLARAIEPVIASGKRALGLPSSYRTRAKRTGR